MNSGTKDWTPYIPFIAVGVGAVLLAWFSFNLPIWSEEHGWLVIAKLVAAGERLNPLLPKSDYPSSFQAFPIGLLIVTGLSPLFASRLTGVLYAGAAAIFFGLISRKFSKGNSWVVFAVALISFSTYSTAFYVMTGWHEITHINLLCAACTYFLYSLLESERAPTWHAIALGAAIGLSFWTLYTPALVAGALLMVLLSRLVRLRLKLYGLATLALTTIPLALGVIQSSGGLLQRHYLWIAKGGEWSNNQYSSENPFSQVLLRSFERIGAVLMPQGAAGNFEGVFPEWSLAICAAIGFILSFADRRKFVAVTVPCMVTTAVLSLSNPTTWRLSILGFYVITYAALALSWIGNKAASRNRHLAFRGVLLLLLAVHLPLFIFQINRAHRFMDELFADGHIATDIAAECEAALGRSETIGAPDFSSVLYLQAILRGTGRFRLVPQSDLTPQSLASTGADILLSLSDKEETFQNLPAGYQRICDGASRGFRYQVAAIQSGAEN